MSNLALRHKSLAQQGYDYSPAQLRQIEWGLRFTPLVCMAGAIVGLITQQPMLHFVLAATGILPFWFPNAHPVDRFYNHLLVPLWNGLRLPANPLPRRIACFMGGAMNVGIGVAFLSGSVPVAYAFGAVLITLQLVVITTHFCLASWMYEGVLRSLGRWVSPVTIARARELLSDGGLLVDVRTPEEFATEHADGAVNVPVDIIEHIDQMDVGQDQPLVFYCRSGLRAQRAIQVLKKKGYTQLHSIGSMARWKQG